MKKVAVIVAGGSGSRMNSMIPKQFLSLNNKPVLWHSVNAFAGTCHDMELIIVLPENHMEEGKNILHEFAATHTLHFVKGGKTRFHSVKNGLNMVKEKAIIFVHDAVRCLITKDLIEKCYRQALADGSAIPAIAATDSIRFINENGKNIVLNRKNVRIIQTPQTFQSAILLPAFQQEYKENFTDEASVVESTGKNISLIEGENENIKITRPIDLIVAEYILKQRQ